MVNGEAIQDIADMFGKQIRPEVVFPAASAILAQNKISPDALTGTTRDEKEVLVQYLSLYNMMKTNVAQYQQSASAILQQSILGNSQIIVFSRK